MLGARKEVTELFDIVKKQTQTIQSVEEGHFNGGIKSFNIPKKEKQTYPERE